MVVRHILWDMGGTLLDTYPTVEHALSEVVAGHGGVVSDADVAALTRGTPHGSIGGAMSELARRFDIDRAEFVAAYDALKKAWKTKPPPVMPGAAAVLAEVRRLGGLNLVVTHRDRASAEALLAATGLVIDDMICAPDGYPRKPDPTMCNEMLRRHGLDPQECIAVGDRDLDVLSSMAAGIPSVRLATFAVPPPAPKGATTIKSLVELLALLG